VTGVQIEPQNELEQALAAAFLHDEDVEALLETLKWAPVVVPVPGLERGEPLGLAPGEPLPFPQVEHRGRVGVPAFTAVQLAASLWAGAERDRLVPLTGLQLAVLWPPDDPALLLNPGASLGTAISGRDVRSLQDVFMRLGPEPLEPDSEVLVSRPGDDARALLDDVAAVAARTSAVRSVRAAVVRPDREGARPYVVLGLELDEGNAAPAAADALVASVARLAPPAFALWPLTSPPADTIGEALERDGVVVYERRPS
jgi:SseB protein C-terminal domain/SseB protein N-terminal domain